jgi:hypothetical protein
MQYLKSKYRESAKVITQGNKPNRVQSILWPSLSRPTTDKILHYVEFPFFSSLKTTRVVENITVVIRKDEFVLDVMLTTLSEQDPHDQLTMTRTK